eukprot:GHVS01066822.1.p1 GENE.GHVS01066822.1~~GHVS01066822.1.p1  ORF type:complete len:189 (-),score=24.30 GHVS01066822.1:305-871(-)
MSSQLRGRLPLYRIPPQLFPPSPLNLRPIDKISIHTTQDQSSPNCTQHRPLLLHSILQSTQASCQPAFVPFPPTSPASSKLSSLLACPSFASFWADSIPNVPYSFCPSTLYPIVPLLQQLDDFPACSSPLQCISTKKRKYFKLRKWHKQKQMKYYKRRQLQRFWQYLPHRRKPFKIIEDVLYRQRRQR